MSFKTELLNRAHFFEPKPASVERFALHVPNKQLDHVFSNAFGSSATPALLQKKVALPDNYRLMTAELGKADVVTSEPYVAKVNAMQVPIPKKKGDYSLFELTKQVEARVEEEFKGIKKGDKNVIESWGLNRRRMQDKEAAENKKHGIETIFIYR